MRESERGLVFAPRFRHEETMATVVSVVIHASQFPQNVQRDLVESLRRREINHKFHYDSVKQAQKWLALHAAHSPWQTDADCRETYDRAFRTVAGRMISGGVHVVGLGCGSGQKDLLLLQRLSGDGKKLSYTPCDVSTALVLTARQSVAALPDGEECRPLVCDLQTADDLPDVFDRHIPTGAGRLVTFFGMLPNFEPSGILARLAGLVRTGDYLLLSANLAPGPDYAAGMQRILPQYDNPLTREWLLSFLLDLGVEREDGAIRFHVEDCPHGSEVNRVSAAFYFCRGRAVQVGTERFEFQPGESIRLFFSYRHTPERVAALAHRAGMDVIEQWIGGSEEEGVFLCQGRS
jgi:uncharacterized SAM-dependent methyltransferase